MHSKSKYLYRAEYFKRINVAVKINKIPYNKIFITNHFAYIDNKNV